MKNTKTVCRDDLVRRISGIESMLRSAKSCLKEDDFFQAAVRLQEIGKDIKIDETMMDIFEAESGI